MTSIDPRAPQRGPSTIAAPENPAMITATDSPVVDQVAEFAKPSPEHLALVRGRLAELAAVDRRNASIARAVMAIALVLAIALLACALAVSHRVAMAAHAEIASTDVALVHTAPSVDPTIYVVPSTSEQAAAALRQVREEAELRRVEAVVAAARAD